MYMGSLHASRLSSVSSLVYIDGIEKGVGTFSGPDYIQLGWCRCRELYDPAEHTPLDRCTPRPDGHYSLSILGTRHR